MKTTNLPPTIEYGDPLAKSHLSIRYLLEHSLVKICGEERILTLTRDSAGYEPAGSAMRHTPETWRVNWESDRGIEGRRFSKEKEARENYASYLPKDNTMILIEKFKGTFEARRKEGEEPFALLLSPATSGHKWAIHYRARNHGNPFDIQRPNVSHPTKKKAIGELEKILKFSSSIQLNLPQP